VDNDPSSSVRIAVLIDADNTSPKYAEALLEELAKYGTPTIKRAYGDFSSQRLSGWTRELNARAIRAIHQNAFTVGKNSTDSALIIDAMDLLYAGNVEAFALVSSDSDFTGLALRLRESGKIVYGLGRQRTPQSLQNACDRFIALEVLGEEPSEQAAERADEDSSAGLIEGADDAPQLNLEGALTRAVNATADDEGWSSVSAIGNHLSRTQASFDPRNFGHAKLSSLVSAQPYLESVTEGRQILVRLKGTPAKAASAKAPSKASSKASTKTAGTATSTTTETKASSSKAASSQRRSTKASATKTAATEAPAAEAPAEAPAAKAPAAKGSSRRKTAGTTEGGGTADGHKAGAEEAAATTATPEPEAEAEAKPTTRPTVTRTTRRSSRTAATASSTPEADSEPQPEPEPKPTTRPTVTRTTRRSPAKRTAAATES
jgi:uncharacterized protein (TIGR00288 family)